MFCPGNFVPLSTEKSKHKAKKCDKNEQNGAVILVPKCQKPFTVRQVILAGKCNVWQNWPSDAIFAYFWQK